MINERYRELIENELEGKNSADESAELARHLQSSTEARAYYDELRDLISMFHDAGEIEPPKDLERRILGSIDERRAVEGARAERGSWLDFFKPRRKLGLAFAAGVAVGLIILLAVYRALPQSSALRMKDLYGTLAGREATRAAAEAGPVDIELPEVSGTARVRYLDDVFVVTVELASKRNIEVAISGPESAVLENVASRAPVPYSLDSASGTVTLETTGQTGFSLTFEDARHARPPVTVRISADGVPVFEKTMIARPSVKR
jgi:hypothetical protein